MNKFLIILLLIYSSFSYASRVAYTNNINTIVYADDALEIPIGYIKANRKVLISDKNFKANTITGILVAGRTAFVKLSDLKLDNEGLAIDVPGSIKDHNVDATFLTDEDRLKEDNYLNFSYGVSGAGADWESFTKAMGSSQNSSLNEYKISVEHRPQGKKYGIGINLSLLTSATDKVKLQAPVFSVEYQRRLFQSGFLSLEGFGNIGVSGDLKITTADNQQSAAVFYGYNLGARLRLFPFSRYNFHGSISTYSYSVNSMKPIEDPNSDQIFLEGLSGARLEFGMTIAI